MTPDDQFPVIIIFAFACFAAIAIIAIVLTLRAQRKRMEALWQLSLRMGLDFNVQDPFGIDSRQDWREVFNTGGGRRVSNVISGRVDDCTLHAFDYRYTTGSGKDETTHYLSAVILDTDLVYPKLTIRPENVLDRIAGVVGYHDIDFESEEFSRKFFVRSEDKKFAYAIVHPKMMEFLLADPRWSIRLAWQSLILHRDRTLTPEEMDHAISFGREFLKLMPDYLKQELRKAKETV